jgi:type II secretory ATPase GspE/PulE/Tfp pilus assembly ATPase PilB-like protein
VSFQVSDASGCPRCRQTGRAGRLAIGEGFLVDEAVREALNDGSGKNLAAALKARGYTTITAAAADEAVAGRITPAEIQALALA